MYLGRVEVTLDWGDLVAVRLLRRWVAARSAAEPPFPALMVLAHELDCPAELAVAMGSLFQLTEGCLGRPLDAECCCSRTIGEDERAVLLMVAAAPDPDGSASEAIPHGLPGALAWAAVTVRQLLGSGGTMPARRAGNGCPFLPASATTGGGATLEAVWKRPARGA